MRSLPRRKGRRSPRGDRQDSPEVGALFRRRLDRRFAGCGSEQWQPCRKFSIAQRFDAGSRRKEAQDAEIVRTWGAAMLRPYNGLPRLNDLRIVANEKLRQDALRIAMRSSG